MDVALPGSRFRHGAAGGRRDPREAPVSAWWSNSSPIRQAAYSARSATTAAGRGRGRTLGTRSSQLPDRIPSDNRGTGYSDAQHGRESLNRRTSPATLGRQFTLGELPVFGTEGLLHVLLSARVRCT